MGTIEDRMIHNETPVHSRQEVGLEEQTDREPTRFDFIGYRARLDSEALGSRKIGLLSQELAERACLDQRTVVASIDGLSIPILVPIEYVDGYDSGRSIQIARTGGRNPEGAVYSLPVSSDIIERLIASDELMNELRSHLGEGTKIYFEHTMDAEDRMTEAAIELLAALGVMWREIPLHDKGAPAENAQAAMSFYVTPTHHVEASVDSGGDISIYDEFREAVLSGEHEMFPDSGVTILSADDLSPEMRDRLWVLYKERFQDLGSNHPISMEDTRELFDELVDARGTTLSVYFSNAEPVAFMFFMTDPASLSWLNQQYIEAHLVTDTNLLFFPGIVAKADGVGKYAKPTIQLPTVMASRTSREYTVAFESTNRSSAYIPRLVYEYVNDSGVLAADMPVPIDTTVYRCIEVD
jgi:hypothetical protein